MRSMLCVEYIAHMYESNKHFWYTIMVHGEFANRSLINDHEPSSFSRVGVLYLLSTCHADTLYAYRGRRAESE